MKPGETIIKAPNDVLDFIFKWKPWLDKASDTISTSTVSVDDGITLDSDSNDTNSATAWISGGQNGCTYKITNKIVTASARTKEQHFYIRVELPSVERNKAYAS